MAKILQINTIAVNGSTGRIVEGIGEAAINHGYESYIAYGRNNPNNSKSELIRIGNIYSVYEHVLETRLFDRQGLASRWATKRFVKQIKEIKPDLIHLHNIHGNYLNYKILFDYFVSDNIPVVWTLHDCWAFTGHCVHFTDVKCYKWKNSGVENCSHCPKMKSYPNSYLFDRSKLNFQDKKKYFTKVGRLIVIPVSYWLGKITMESFLNKFPIHVIQNGIDVETFYPRLGAIEIVRNKYGIGKRFMILGVAAGWSDDVGLSEFLWLRRVLPNEHFAIVLVGVSEKQKRMLPNGIIGITRTWNSNELAEIYTASDVLFNGSFQETFGLVTAEAMACGTPVIVYDSTACPEIVQDQRTGYIIRVGDRNMLLDRIFLLAKNWDKKVINQNCINYVQKNLDKKQKFDEYIDLYNSILNI